MSGGGKHRKTERLTGLAVVFALAVAGAAHAADAPAVTAPPVAAAAAPSDQANTAITIMQVDSAIQSGDCAKALPLLAQLWDDPYLQAQDAVLAEKYRYSRIICTLQTQDIKAALTLSSQNIDHAGVGIISYDLHAFLQVLNEQPEEAAATLDTALTRFPNDVSKLTDESVVGALLGLEAKNPGAASPLLDHLEKLRWQVDDVTLRIAVDYLRLQGLRAAVKRHDRVADFYRADLATSAVFYIVSQGDGDISDAAVPPLPIKPIIKKQINEVGAYVADNPNELFAVDYLITLEHMNEDDDVALVQIGTILDLLNANGLDKFDSPESLPSLFVHKATLLAQAGRVDAAAQTYKDAAARMSGDVFDFTTSYMDFLIDIGRDQEALALENRIDILALTPEQRQHLAATEACAYAYMGDTVRYQASLRLSLGDDGLSEMRTYLCAGDVEHAAQALIRNINDPDNRDGAITKMQITLPDIPYSPRTKAYYTAFAALKKRPDVQAAVKAQNIVIRSWLLRF